MYTAPVLVIALWFVVGITFKLSIRFHIGFAVAFVIALIIAIIATIIENIKDELGLTISDLESRIDKLEGNSSFEE